MAVAYVSDAPPNWGLLNNARWLAHWVVLSYTVRTRSAKKVEADHNMAQLRHRAIVGVGVVMALGVGVGLVAHYFVSPGALKVIGEIGGPVVGLLAPIVGELWRARRLADPRPIDMLADLLARAVRAQWRKAATERLLLVPEPIPVSWSLNEQVVTMPVEIAVGDPNSAPAFPPLPGQIRVTKEILRAGGGRRELFAVYGGLASGRIVVLGAPGAGKTGSALLLVLDVLEYRDCVDDKDRARVPVPLLLTATGWDPSSCSVQDWLATQLAATYPLFQHRGGQAEAAELIAGGAIALFLDGLDEIDVAQRPAALQALSDAPFRVVVLSRVEEMVQAADAAWLVGAVAIHLHEITGPEGADYLERAHTGRRPDGWTELLSHLRHNPDSAVTKGLCTPLALTLIRDTYRPEDDLSQLLNTTRFSTADEIDEYLIARVLPDAYATRPGRPRPPYNESQARQALTFFAQQMNQNHTIDLAWWQIPGWAPTKWRMLTSIFLCGLLGGLLGGFLSGLTFMLGVRHGLWTSLSKSVVFGFMFGLGIGLPMGLRFVGSGREPNRVRTWRAISLQSVLTAGLAYGLVLLLAAMLIRVAVNWLPALIEPGPRATTDSVSNTIGLLVIAFTAGLTVGLPLGLHRNPLGGRSKNKSKLQELRKSRHKDRRFKLNLNFRSGLGYGLLAGITFGLGVGIPIAMSPDYGGIADGLVTGLTIGLGVWFVIWFVVGILPRLAAGITLVAGLILGLVAGIGSALSPGGDLAYGSGAGLGAGIIVGLMGVVIWFVVGFVVGILPRLAAGITLVAGLIIGLVAGIGSVFSLGGHLAFRIGAGLGIGLIAGLIVELMGLVGWFVVRLLPRLDGRITLGFGVTVGLAAGIADIYLPDGTMQGILFGIEVGIVSGLLACLLFWLLPPLAVGIALGFGFVAGFAAGIAEASSLRGIAAVIEFAIGFGLTGGFMVGLAIWLVGWLVPQLAEGFVTGLTAVSAEGARNPQGPLENWRNDRMFGLVTGLAFGLTFGLVTGLAFTLVFGLVGLVAGLELGLAVGVLYGITSSVTWPTILAWRLQLQRSHRIPAISLMPFLEDARGRGVLRTAGAVYQFRHATLQDYLATQTTPNTQPISVTQDAGVDLRMTRYP